MPGKILSINAEVGDTISSGRTVLVMEAMKMKTAIRVPAESRVSEIRASIGETVAPGQVLVVVEPV